MAFGIRLVTVILVFITNISRDAAGFIEASPTIPAITTFGTNDRVPQGLASAGKIYLFLRIPAEGILYKVEPFFMTTDPVFIQIWYHEDDYYNKYRLVYQKEVSSDQINVTKTIYLVENDSDCPLVDYDMILGLWSPSGHIPIPYYWPYDTGEFTLVASRGLPQYLNMILDFQVASIPYQFDIKGYLYPYADSYRRKRSPTAPCPFDVMPQPTEAAPEETPEYYDDADSGDYEDYTSNPDYNYPVTDSADTTTPEEDTPTSGLINKKVLYYVAGGAAALILILLLVIVCCVVRRRRQPSRPEPVTGGRESSMQKVADKLDHSDRRNPAYVSSPSAYERTRQRDPPTEHEYVTVMGRRRASGVYEEISDKPVKPDDSSQTATYVRGGPYLQPVDQRRHEYMNSRQTKSGQTYLELDEAIERKNVKDTK